MALEVRKGNDRFTVIDSDLDKVDNGDKDTTYTLRALSSETVREIRKRHTPPPVFSKRTHRLEPVPLTEEQEIAYGLDLLDYALVEWSGVVYQGEPLPCTRDHKALLDVTRRQALVAVAGLNQTTTPAGEAARQESFRQPA